MGGNATLAEQIEAMRAQALAEHHSLMMRVSDLDAVMSNADGALIRALTGIIDGQARRGEDIKRAFAVIQSRIAPLLTGRPQPAPNAAGPVNGIDGRYAPPMRAVSSYGDELGLYGNQSGPAPSRAPQ